VPGVLRGAEASIKRTIQKKKKKKKKKNFKGGEIATLVVVALSATIYH